MKERELLGLCSSERESDRNIHAQGYVRRRETFGNLVWKFQTPLIARNPLTSSFDLFFLEMMITEILMVKNALNNCDLQHTILPLSSYHPPFISLMSLMPLCQLHVRPQCLLTHKHSQRPEFKSSPELSVCFE